MIRSLIRSSSNFSRSFSTTTAAVRFGSIGQPTNVLKYETDIALPAVGPDDVSVRFLAAPINPADLLTVEGIYGTLPKSFPAFAGGEGVAVVKEIGANVTSVKVGDWVVPAKAGFGTWREAAVANESNFISVPNDILAPYAASLAVNPSTAYRLLHDFGNLQEGDWIIQNGANSTVGLAIVQMARERGIRTINVVRHDRPTPELPLKMLTALGGDINVLDNYLKTQGFQDILADIAPIKVAFNTVGGESATDLARSLGNNGTLVTYGAMSRKPISIPFELLTEKQLSLKGFWMSAWNEAHSREERQDMMKEIAKLIRANKLFIPFELHDFDDFNHALTKSQEPFRLRKVILNMDYPDRFAEHDKLSQSDYEQFSLPSW